MAFKPTACIRQTRLIPFWQCHPRHHCIPNIARAQLHSEKTAMTKAPRESDVLSLGDFERIKCDTCAQKERSGESTPDQTEAGFNILCLARAEGEKLEPVKPSMLTGIEVRSKYELRPGLHEQPPPHLIQFHPRTTFQARQEIGRLCFLTIPLHLLSLVGQLTKPDCACSLIKKILWIEEYILTKSVPEVSFYSNCRLFCKHPFTTAVEHYARLYDKVAMTFGHHGLDAFVR